MDIIVTGNSGYSTGQIDTATVLQNGVSPRQAEHVNGCAAAILQIETILGPGTTLKGSMADLVARLAVALGADGKLNLSNPASVSTPLGETRGGTGLTSVTPGAILAGSGTGTMVSSGAGVSSQALLSGGVGPPFWSYGMLFHGPSSIAGSSAILHSGNMTIASPQSLGGFVFCTNFTLNAGVTITIPSGSRRLCIFASQSITINGTLNGAGAGGAGGTSTNDGADGTDQAGGTGGVAGSQVTPPGTRGLPLVHGISLGTGQVTQHPLFMSPWLAMGGAGGSGGGVPASGTGGTGGNGGASIILIAPVITLGNTSVLTTNGNAGGAATGNAGGGGGGGAGNIYMISRVHTNNGATFNQNGGSGGSNSGGSGAVGGAGTAGVRQALVFG